MDFVFAERGSDSSLVNLVWRTQSERAGMFSSLAVSHWEMVVTQEQDRTYFTVHGPETRATPAPVPEHARFMGIQFKLGAYMPHLPPSQLVDGALFLPAVGKGSFWLNGSRWEFPTYENADVFVERLVRAGLLAFDWTVQRALHDEPVHLSQRSVQRAFVRATGLSHRKIAQIERARHAMELLQRGVSILDTVAHAGYADQPHLTRSLKQLIGQTPAQLSQTSQAD